MFSRSLRPSSLTLLLLLGFLASSPSLSAAEQQGMAPDFTLKSRSGQNLKLSELKGEVVMVNFWASWCGPCRQEMPLLDQLYKRYQSMGFTILGVNVEEDSSAAEKVLKELPVSFPILFDKQNEVSKLYGIAAMPSTFLVDRDGKLRYLHKGYLPGYEDDYQQQIRELIRE